MYSEEQFLYQIAEEWIVTYCRQIRIEVKEGLPEGRTKNFPRLSVKITSRWPKEETRNKLCIFHRRSSLQKLLES